jgi:hypothetical protein
MRRPPAFTPAVLLAALALLTLSQAHCANGGWPAPFSNGVDAGPPGTPATTGRLADAGSAFGSMPDSAAASPLDGCAIATDQVQRSPIAMLVVLDASGSMLDDFKWAAVVPALEGFIDDIAQRHDPSFGVGLTIFSDTNDPTQGAGPYPKMDVPVAYVDPKQASALHGRLDGAVPQGPTPTLPVLVGQYAALEAFTSTPPLLANGKKVLVLITDGVPYPNADEQKAAVLQLATNELAKAGPAGPITTFAVGVGYTFPYAPSVYDQVFMGNLAFAGGAPNEPCDPDELTVDWNMCHFQVTPSGQSNAGILEAQFHAAIDKIRSKVTSCSVGLIEDPTRPVDPRKVNVTFTDSVTGVVSILTQDGENGWTYDDPGAPTAVTLHGSSCKMLEDDPDGMLQIVLGCATLVK